MVKIRLFCAAGMSTSLIVQKMQAAAVEKGLEIDVKAYPESDLDRHLDGTDVALLGPQVGYKLKHAKSVCEAKGVPIDIIPMVDYGMMNGANILEFALKLIKE